LIKKYFNSDVEAKAATFGGMPWTGVCSAFFRRLFESHDVGRHHVSIRVSHKQTRSNLEFCGGQGNA